jgi:hypothetical protein
MKKFHLVLNNGSWLYYKVFIKLLGMVHVCNINGFLLYNHRLVTWVKYEKKTHNQIKIFLTDNIKRLLVMYVLRKAPMSCTEQYTNYLDA